MSGDMASPGSADEIHIYHQLETCNGKLACERLDRGNSDW